MKQILRLGPTGVLLKSARPWLAGALINNVWSVSVEDHLADVNQMLLQPFVNYNVPDKPGRYLVFSPIITANWKASSSDTWTVPLGLAIGQVMKFGRQPVNVNTSAYYKRDQAGPGRRLAAASHAHAMFPKGGEHP